MHLDRPVVVEVVVEVVGAAELLQVQEACGTTSLSLSGDVSHVSDAAYVACRPASAGASSRRACGACRRWKPSSERSRARPCIKGNGIDCIIGWTGGREMVDNDHE